MGFENITPHTLKHLVAQPAAAWQSLIVLSAGIPSWSQQSWADTTTSSETTSSSLGMAIAPATGSIATDSTTRSMNMVRSLTMNWQF